MVAANPPDRQGSGAAYRHSAVYCWICHVAPFVLVWLRGSATIMCLSRSYADGDVPGAAAPAAYGRRMNFSLSRADRRIAAAPKIAPGKCLMFVTAHR